MNCAVGIYRTISYFGKLCRMQLIWYNKYLSLILISKEEIPIELQIHHTGNQNGSAMFEVIRSMDMKHTAAVSLSDPAKFPVQGHPAKQFLPELSCYL